MSTVAPPLTSVAELIAEQRVRILYQPIVELASRRIVGYEALARGPEGSVLESPSALFGAAAREGILAELDRACRKEALEGALRAGLDSSLLLFLNVEPAALDSKGVLSRVRKSELDRVSIVVELTERALASRPREVLTAVRWLRERNCRIALDDVGVDKRSLALMPFLAPDIIKLDVSLVQSRLPALDAARILNAVGAEAERSGAMIVAEGIETEEHLRRACAIGATLGQGWLLGLPDQLDPTAASCRRLSVPSRPPAETDRRTPFQVIASVRTPRPGDKRLLLSISQQLEQEALGLAGEAVVMAAFQDEAFFSHRTSHRYRHLACQAALVGVLGAGMPRHPGGYVRGASLDPSDPLRGEWDVIVVSPHFASAFAARDLGDEGADLERRFDYVVSYDWELVTDAARRLLAKIIPAPQPSTELTPGS